MPNITAPVADIFPNDVDPANGNAKYKEGRTVFQYKKLTVDRDFDGQYGYGLKFKEDPEGSIWNIDGEWDKDQRKYLDYAGDHYQAGQIVNVQLVHEEYKKRDGTQGEARRVWGISLSDESPTELATPAAQATPAAPVARSYDQNRPAALGMTANMLSAMSNAGNTEKIGVTSESAWAILKDVMICNLEGRPLDEALEPLLSLLVPAVTTVTGDLTVSGTTAEESPMVQAAVEAGGVITEVTENEEVQTVKW